MTITVKVSENTMNEMKDFFDDFKRPKTPAYAVFKVMMQIVLLHYMNLEKLFFKVLALIYQLICGSKESDI